MNTCSLRWTVADVSLIGSDFGFEVLSVHARMKIGFTYFLKESSSLWSLPRPLLCRFTKALTLTTLTRLTAN